jgi:hypothetical protein
MEVVFAFFLGVAIGLLLGLVVIPLTVDTYVHARRRGW